MTDCTLSLDGIDRTISEKVPCFIGLSETSIQAKNCNFKGDSECEVVTAGILGHELTSLNITDSNFIFHAGGGIMLNLHEESDASIIDCKIQ